MMTRGYQVGIALVGMIVLQTFSAVPTGATPARILSFSGYDWWVKSSTAPVGPGPNVFSEASQDVWVDAQGRLHLRIAQRNGQWYATEVVNTQSLGYGTYRFYVASRVDQLDPNIVLGLFTWDTQAPEYHYREIDIEFARWGDPNNANAQYVVQPWDTAGNRQRFNVQLNGDYSTHEFRWIPGRVDFRSWHGHSPAPPSEGYLIQSWTYTGQDVPPAGGENVRINLWLMNGWAPTDGQEAEVIIQRFEFIPRPSPKVGDVSGDGTISALDASLILQYVVGLIDEFPVDSLGAPADGPPRDYTLRLPSLSLKPGERVRMPLLIEDAAGLTAGGLRLRYDPAVLRVVNATPTLLLNGALWHANPDPKGEIRLAFAMSRSNTGGGALFEVTFEALPGSEGTETPLEWIAAELSGSRQVRTVDGLVRVLPSQTRLLPNYPNPFNPETWIPYQLAEPSPVVLRIYSASGALVRQMDLGERPAGVYVHRDRAIYWDGRNNVGELVASGVYFYQMSTPNFRQIRRMVIVR